MWMIYCQGKRKCPLLEGKCRGSEEGRVNYRDLLELGLPACRKLPNLAQGDFRRAILDPFTGE